MTTLIRCRPADFAANALGFLPPVAAGLLGWWYFGGTLAQSIRNLAPGGVDATVVGAPAVSAGYISCVGNSAYLNTSIAEPPEATILVGMRSMATFATSANETMPVSSYGPSGGLGFWLAKSGASVGPIGVLRAHAFVDNAGAYLQVAASVTETNLSTWKFASLTVDDGVGVNVYDQTDNLTAGATSALARKILVPPRTFRIGSSHNSTFAGGVDLAFVAIYNRVLTPTERASVYAAAKVTLARRSIVV
ncbi:hypothetical protein ACQW02_25555 [Humitalea sp. 24SJ18S-53]|uniref:hypothetical protein n=1 Tax=Humitalea sp. 24SJ18S-53 TaxID=3422307 RepID=UPI003D66D4FE